MQIKHTKVNASSDTGDVSKIQPSDWNASHSIDGLTVIDANTTFSIAADGSGSYATLRHCIEALNSAVILPDKTITINLDAGIHLQSAEVMDTNPSHRYSIVGATPASVSITSTSVSGSADNFTVVYTLSATVPAGTTTGMFFSVHNNGADWPAGYYHFGSHEITAIGTNTLTCKVKSHNTPQTVSSVSIPAQIMKTVIKANFTGTALFSVLTGQAKGYVGTPYLKNLVFNSNNTVDNAFTIFHNTLVVLYPGVQKTYNLAFVNSKIANMYILEMSSLIAFDGTVIASGGEEAGIFATGISKVDFGRWTIISGNRGAGGWYRGFHLETSDGISLNSFLIDNRYSALTAFGGIMRVTAIRENSWGSSGIISVNSGINVGA